MSQSRYVLKPTPADRQAFNSKRQASRAPLHMEAGLTRQRCPCQLRATSPGPSESQSQSQYSTVLRGGLEAGGWRRLSAIQRGRSQSRGCVPAETKPARVWLSGRLPQGAAHKIALFFLLAAAWLTSATHFSSLIGSVFTLSAWYLTGVHVVGLERLVSKSARRREGVMRPEDFTIRVVG
jgi:hypothetical protein